MFQWSLVCEREDIGDLISPVYTAGLLLGSVIGGVVSDRWGHLNIHKGYVTGALRRFISPAVRLYVLSLFSLFKNTQWKLCITGPLCWECTGNWWNHRTKGQWCRKSVMPWCHHELNAGYSRYFVVFVQNFFIRAVAMPEASALILGPKHHIVNIFLLVTWINFKPHNEKVITSIIKCAMKSFFHLQLSTVHRWS